MDQIYHQYLDILIDGEHRKLSSFLRKPIPCVSLL